jgi:sulfate permease, SulP family
LRHTNGWSLGIAVGVFGIIVVAQLLNRRVPGALIGLILSVIVVDAFNLKSHGVAVLGTVHGGLPHLGWPSASWTEVRGLVGTVLTVAFVCIAQTAATLRRARDSGQPAEDFNRDLIGVGAGSIAAGLLGSMAVDSSPPNTALTMASGGRTQLANATAAVVVFAVAIAAMRPLDDLPDAVLGATLVFVATKLFRAGDLRNIFRFDRWEFGLASAALLVVALVGIEQGVAVAMVLSLADRTRRYTRPRDGLLGRVPGTDHWIPTDIGHPTEQVAGVLVYLVYAPIWYGNADFVRARVLQFVRTAASPVRTLILDANGMSDIDYTGLQAVKDLVDELGAQHISIGIARASHLVHHDLKHGALLGHLGADHLFTSVEEAVVALSGGS